MRSYRFLLAAPLVVVLGGSGVTIACDDDGGPLSPLTSATWIADLDAVNEIPAPTGQTASATGRALFTLNANTITYQVSFSGLSSNAILGHVHFGAAGATGTPIHTFVNIPAATSGVIAGTINLTPADVAEGAHTMSADSLKSLFSKQGAYVNMHTSANTSGEIRGQIRPR